MLHDISCYPVTCSSQEAVQLYNKAVEAFVSLKEKFLGYLAQAVELDGSFLLAHCFLVGCMIARAFVDYCTKLVFTITCMNVCCVLYCTGLRVCGLSHESFD